MHYEGKIGEDLFQSEEDAKHFLLNVRKLSFKHELRFPALIGMVVTSRTAELLIGTKVCDHILVCSLKRSELILRKYLGAP